MNQKSPLDKIPKGNLNVEEGWDEDLTEQPPQQAGEGERITALLKTHHIGQVVKAFMDHEPGENIIEPKTNNRYWQSWIKSGCVKPLSKEEVNQQWEAIQNMIDHSINPYASVDRDYLRFADLDPVRQENYLIERGMLRESYDNQGNRRIQVDSAAVYQHITKVILENNYFTFTDSEETHKYGDGVWRKLNKARLRNMIYTLMDKRASTRMINELSDRIQFARIKNREEIPPEPYNKICLENGVLNLETQELEAYRPDYYFFGKLPLEYNPNAECPNIQEALDKSLPRKEAQLNFWEIAGQCVSGHNPTKKLFILEGGTNAGKSVLVELLVTALGSDNCVAVPMQDLEKDRHYCRAKLFGRKLVYFADISNRPLEDLYFIKSITGQDTVMARNIYSRPFEFTYYGNVVYSANELPNIIEDNDAIWDRVHMLLFEDEIPPSERIERGELMETLTSKQELSGFLNKALSGLDRLRENGEFTEAIDREKLRHTYRSKSDTIYKFIGECVSMEPGIQELKSDVYNAYLTFCESENIRETKTKRKFLTEFQNLMKVSDGQKTNAPDKGRAIFKGVKLLRVEEVEQEKNLLYRSNR